jgi:hypothetical protein
MDRVNGTGGKGAQSSLRPLRSWRARIAAATALALIVPLAAAGVARASVPPSFFGTVPWLNFQGEDFQHLQEANVHNARTPFFWPSIEPSKRQFNWGPTDRFVGALATVHVRVLPFLNGSPSWVAGDSRKPPVRTKKAKKRWKQFVRACVMRYGPNGLFWVLHPTIPKVPITSWQIWNEQNSSDYFAPRANPKQYAKVVRLARNAARTADKHAKIVLGGMFGKPEPKGSMTAPHYLNKLYKVHGAKRLFNVVAVHPYSPTIHNLKHQMSALRTVIKRHHDNAKMWITEVGWGSAPPSKHWPLLKGVQGQKRMLKKAYHVLINNRKRWRLQRVYWFLWRDASPDAPVNCSFCKSSGLFTYDYKPKPAWQAFLDMTQR